MAILEDHGGECCGIRHIYAMDDTPVADIEEMIRELEGERNIGNATSGRMIEIVLSSRQVGDRAFTGRNGWHESVVAEGGWPAVMQRLGFRLVSRFNNANSGRECFVFHRVPHFLSTRVADLPFTWTYNPRPEHTLAAGGPGVMPAPRVEVREAPVRVVATFFANVLTTGMGAYFPTLERARRAAPRCRQQARIDIYSDGTLRTNDL